LVSTILSSSALRSAEPGGGGGTVRGFLRPPDGTGSGAGFAAAAAAATGNVGFAVEAGAAGDVGFAVEAGDAGAAGDATCAAGAAGFAGSDSTVQPDARSSIRAFVSSPSRRRERSSSGTGTQ
jgi:hypothetical protein